VSQRVVYEDSNFILKYNPFETPWYILYTKGEYKEFSHMPKDQREYIFEYLYIIEKAILEYFKPTKINIASFGNYYPKVHWHIIARFENDSFFPESVWGQKQRSSIISLPPLEPFEIKLTKELKECCI